MRKFLIAGNWKMNGSRTTTAELLTIVKQKMCSSDNAELAVFPPYPLLEQTERLLSGTAIAWGAQDVAAEINGAFTGEVSASMLKEFGCQYVIVGHSERRLLFGETNEYIAKKFQQAILQGLQPILCVGETKKQRQAGQTFAVIQEQLSAVLNVGVDCLKTAVIAYEPVWAIGTGQSATPEEAQAVHAFLRGEITSKNRMIAEQLRLLYGGSLKASNAQSLLSMPDIDGGLIGGASLDAEGFLQIFHSVA